MLRIVGTFFLCALSLSLNKQEIIETHERFDTNYDGVLSEFELYYGMAEQYDIQDANP